MEIHFEKIISGFSESRVGISNKFLSTDLAFKLKQNLINLYQQDDLKHAGIGKELNLDKTIRKDKIFWLDRTVANATKSHFFLI